MKIKIITPQFHRHPDEPIPSVPENFEDLRGLSAQELRELGLKCYIDPKDDPTWPHDRSLWLLPGEWYPYIPSGFALVFIDGREEQFQPGVTDEDIRFGCLPYGILAKG